LDLADASGFTPDRILCTGDVAAYCADPQACADLLREAGVHVVKGNCEEAFGSRADDCGCGFDEGSTCDQLSARWFAYAEEQLDDTACAWMASRPDAITFTMAGRRFRAVHASATSNNQFVFASTPESEKRRQLDIAEADAILCGHSGLPFTQRIGDCVWHNAGVIGMPANDGTPRTWFSVLTPGADGIRFSHQALRYDHHTAARRMANRGLPAEYSSCLVSGLWDNCDILPEAETLAQGMPIVPSSLLWAPRGKGEDAAAPPAPAIEWA
jgi:predicted phosphodiesterase